MAKIKKNRFTAWAKGLGMGLLLTAIAVLVLGKTLLLGMSGIGLTALILAILAFYCLYLENQID